MIKKLIMEKEQNFEKLLEKLQTIVEDLESGNCPLEESIKKFSEGMSLAKSCQDKLNTAEQKIELLVSANKEGLVTKPFSD